MFCACEMGERLSNQFNAINDTLCKSKWYSFPIGIQRIMVIVIANAQQDAYIQSFGTLPCARNSFKMVNHCQLTIFLPFIQIDMDQRFNFYCCFRRPKQAFHIL